MRSTADSDLDFLSMGSSNIPTHGTLGSVIHRLDIIFDTVDENDAVMEEVRIRKSPWRLLHRRMKDTLSERNLSEKLLKSLLNCVGNSNVIVEYPAHQKSSPSMYVFE